MFKIGDRVVIDFPGSHYHGREATVKRLIEDRPFVNVSVVPDGTVGFALNYEINQLYLCSSPREWESLFID